MRYYVKNYEGNAYYVIDENEKQVSSVMSYEDAKELCKELNENN